MKKLIQKIMFSAGICIAASPLFAEEFEVHRYAAETWNTNSYWLESESGIVLIDALLLTTDAELLATMLESTGKPIAGAIITHDHTDHTGGLNTLIARLGDFPVITTQNTADHFASTHEELKSWVAEHYDPVPPKATQIVEDGEALTLAGIDFVIDDIGPGEGANNLLVHVPEANILFTGDTTNHGHHIAGMRSGRASQLLAQRKYIKDTYGDVTMLYPGHGDPARPAAVLDAEIDYITLRFNMVREALKSPDNLTEDGTDLNEATQARLTAEVMARYAHLNDYGFDPAGIVSGGWSSLVKEVIAEN